LHWPCITDFGGLSTYRLKDLRKGDEHPAYAPVGVWHLHIYLGLFPAIATAQN